MPKSGPIPAIQQVEDQLHHRDFSISRFQIRNLSMSIIFSPESSWTAASAALWHTLRRRIVWLLDKQRRPVSSSYHVESQWFGLIFFLPFGSLTFPELTFSLNCFASLHFFIATARHKTFAHQGPCKTGKKSNIHRPFLI